ncbi:MAG: hypothetical protein NVS9B7_07630 [Flavisolibacter sp.]
MIERNIPDSTVKSASKENIVNRKTYKILKDTMDEAQWSATDLNAFKKIYLPVATAQGMERFLTLTRSQHPVPTILNMTELTPLAVEVPFVLEKGKDIPLWYHLGVGMFNQQAEQYERKIMAKNYGFILFEYVPSLNNFYPFRVRDSIRKYYDLVDSFPAPRRGDTPGVIELYKKP